MDRFIARLSQALFLILAPPLTLAASPVGPDAKLSAVVRERAARTDSVDVVIRVAGRADLRGLALFETQAGRGRETMRRLQAVADSSQGPLKHWLDARGIEHRDFWIVNAIAARIPAAALAELAARADVELVAEDSRVKQLLPQPDAARGAKSTLTTEWGVDKVRAPQVWAEGFTGNGVVVAGADTGYQWNHPALRDHYRGWNGMGADHAYQWHDAIHGSLTGGSNPCGYSVTSPCDDAGHGTHTMGTMVGDDGGGNQVGVAPGARWIGCRNMDQGTGSPATYIECFQWFVAPTDAVDTNPDPSKAPQVINNSWSCPISEGCDAAGTDLLRDAVEATRAAGILVVVSAGNAGPGCGSVADPPGIFAVSFTVGATDVNDGIAFFSSRGPVVVDGSNLLKPDVSAPGVGVRSAYPIDSYANLSGTSMAGPHAAGVAALIMSAFPDVRGKPDLLERLIKSNAIGLTSGQDCGSFAGAQVPNTVFGYGRIDALAAVHDYLFANQFE